MGNVRDQILQHPYLAHKNINTSTCLSKQHVGHNKKRRKKMGGTEKKKAELILLPIPATGHLASAHQLAQLLINRSNNLSITILCFNFPFSTPSSLLPSHPQITLIHLPQVEPPPFDLPNSPEIYIWTYMETLKPHVKATLQNLLSSYPHPVVGFVLDFFCLSMIDVGNELGVPSYMFMTSNVGLSAFLLSLLNRQIQDVFNDSDPEWFIPGFPDPVPPRVFPDPVFKKDGGYFALYQISQRIRDTKGIIVNSFSELEQYAIDALSDDGQNPPIYAVGPLLDHNVKPDPSLDQAQHDKILKWLDEQPPSSVVFLCFGSVGRFGPRQTREIAFGLKSSGVSFLWAMRSLPTSHTEERALPEGFLEWMEMEGRGMLCEWAPQVEVLAHRAIGGFVSHCGWNSILESLWYGVSILTWPIYAEQQLNAFMMVKEWGLGVELRLDHRKGSDPVMAEEIEKGLKRLMDKENVVHKKVQHIKEVARKAVLSGGSSFISVGKLIHNMTGSN